MAKFLRHILGLNKTVILMVVMFTMFVSKVNSQKFNACGTDSVWGAYMIDRSIGEIVDFYYPEEFFSGDGAAIPYLDSIRNIYMVPHFYYGVPSCELDSFELKVIFNYSDRYRWGDIKTVLSTYYVYAKYLDYKLDFDDILRNKDEQLFKEVSVTKTHDNKSELRYSSKQDTLWFKYKNGVLEKSNGDVYYETICKLVQFDLSWNKYGGKISQIYLKINDDVYEEDFSDCSNAMIYKECPPKEPDYLKVICEQLPNCRDESYKFYVETNLDDVHWVSLDGLSNDGKKLRLPMYDFNGGCIAVWGQRDSCTMPIYDTICPPIPDLSSKETNVEETICWNDRLYVNGKRVTESGMYDEIRKTESWCDSIVHHKVTVNSGDTTILDTVYRCGMNFDSNHMYLYDTIDVAGACPELHMNPIGEMTDKYHLKLKKVKEEPEAIYVDAINNVGNVTYITIFQGQVSERKSEGVVEFDKFGTYQIIAYDETTGCTDSMSFVYAVSIEPDPYFSPDDSNNSKWNIKGIGKYSNYEICIYDRFGKKLVCFQNQFDGWDGTYQGHPMPSTDYWYSIEVLDINYSTCGHFTLYRFDK